MDTPEQQEEEFGPVREPSPMQQLNGGWKGRSLWASYSTRTMYHLEGGKENRPKVVRFQLRPDPLAR